jgi:putative transposase
MDRLRLNENQFFSVEHARRIIAKWRECYHEERPHSSLGMKTPKEFAPEQVLQLSS